MTDALPKEIYGLQVLVDDAIEKGTLHVIAPPPDPADYATEAEYLDAYYGSMSWRTTIKGIGDE